MKPEEIAWKRFERLFPKEANAIERARFENSAWFETKEGYEIYRHWEAYRMGYLDGDFDVRFFYISREAYDKLIKIKA